MAYRTLHTTRPRRPSVPPQSVSQHHTGLLLFTATARRGRRKKNGTGKRRDCFRNDDPSRNDGLPTQRFIRGCGASCVSYIRSWVFFPARPSGVLRPGVVRLGLHRGLEVRVEAHHDCDRLMAETLLDNLRWNLHLEHLRRWRVAQQVKVSTPHPHVLEHAITSIAPALSRRARRTLVLNGPRRMPFPVGSEFARETGLENGQAIQCDSSRVSQKATSGPRSEGIAEESDA